MRPAEKMAKEATAPASGDVFFQCFISRVRKSMIAFTRCALLRRILVSDTLLAYKSRKLCDSRCVSLYSTPCHVDTSVKSPCLSSIHSIAFMPTREISELSAGLFSLLWGSESASAGSSSSFLLSPSALVLFSSSLGAVVQLLGLLFC